MTLFARICFKIKSKRTFLTILIFISACSVHFAAKPDSKYVLVLELRGMTYEMLDRAYAPNIKYLIKNGFLASIAYRDPTEDDNENRPRTSIRRTLGRMVQCYDSAAVFSSSLNTVGLFNDTIRGPFSLFRKNFRSNESMVKDFINSNNGTNVRFSFLSFRTFTSKNQYLERDQINELTTIDSLIGIVFKSYQEKVKWEQTTVMIITDGRAGHKYDETELYKNTPLIIKGPSVPNHHDPGRVVPIGDVIGLAIDILGIKCTDSSVVASRAILERTDSTTTPNKVFVHRPDILIYPVLNRNQIDVELLGDNETGKIFYTIDGTSPIVHGIEYKSLINIAKAGEYTIKAATNHNNEWSSVTTQKAVLRLNLQSIEIDPLPDAKYLFNGADELVDQDTAGLKFDADKWLGFQGKDVNFLFNFGAKRIVHRVDLSALQDYASWIFLPKKVTIFVGDDRNNLIEAGSMSYEAVKDVDVNIRKHYVIPITDEFISKLPRNLIQKKKKMRCLHVKYLSVKVEAVKGAPEWFSLPGAQTWFFTDEIKID